MHKNLLHIFILTTLFLTLLASCEQRPDNVVSKSKMEQLLYDYHLAKSMVNQLPPDEKYKEQLYIDAVMKKNKVTQDEFDSSLVWYNRHNSELKDIYDNLNKRFETADKELQLSTGNTSMANVASSDGDTANIWNGAAIIVLRPKPSLNHESFIIKADTSFHRFDKYIMSGDLSLVNENNMNRNSSVTLSLSIRYDDGKVISDTRTLRNAARQELTIEARDDKDIASVSGFINYNNNNAEERSIAIVNNLTLIRMHKPDSLIHTHVHPDTVATDTLPAVSKDSTRPSRHLTPDELREQNRDDEGIKLKTAPDASKIKRRFNRRGTNNNNNRPRQQQKRTPGRK
ncbi:MAG: DUF4296 domain-containing protein [Bacteroidaceae bacterium]|nr:DUF4296 domain-containing protein [Bacteroidaceae bacterium]